VRTAIHWAPLDGGDLVDAAVMEVESTWYFVAVVGVDAVDAGDAAAVVGKYGTRMAMGPTSAWHGHCDKLEARG